MQKEQSKSGCECFSDIQPTEYTPLHFNNEKLFWVVSAD